MARKATNVVLAGDVERARLLALTTMYEALIAAAVRFRLYFAGDMPIDDLAILEELRNQAVTLTALAPPVERAPDAASEQINRIFESMFPGLYSTPAKEDGA